MSREQGPLGWNTAVTELLLSLGEKNGTSGS
jgi:hypothetical protein